MSPPKSMWSPNPQYRWRWGLWEVIKLRWDLASGEFLPRDGINALQEKEETLERLPCPHPPSPLPLHHVRAQQEGSHSPAPKSPHQKPNPAGSWFWTSQPPELWEKKGLLFEPPSLRYFVVAAWVWQKIRRKSQNYLQSGSLWHGGWLPIKGISL